MNKPAVFTTTALLTALLLAGCDQQQQQRGVDPRSLKPVDPDLAALYLRSCFACHATAASNAPLTGDQQAWQPRLSQGMDRLVDRVVQGYRGMPPMGLCMDCSADEFAQLIAFMATEPAVAEPQEPR